LRDGACFGDLNARKRLHSVLPGAHTVPVKLLMVSGDRSILSGRKGAFWYTLQEMQKHWDRIDVICPRVGSREDGTATQKDHVSSGMPHNVFFHPNPRGLWHQPSWIFHQGHALIRAHHHDVMTVHEYPPFYNGRGALALHRSTGIPFALEIHHIVGWPVAANLQERIGHRLSRWVLPREARHAARVRVVSNAVAQELMHWGVPGGSLEVIPSFYLDHEIIGRVAAPPKSYDIAFCGRLVANKGCAALIDALQHLPDARLLIAGDGPLRPKLEEQIHAMHAEHRVNFLGWLPTLEAVLEAMLTARVFVMPSLSEGGPRSALEAMACGMPVVSTRVGVMPEVIEDGVNGLFTDGTSRDIAARVGCLLADSNLRERMGKAAMGILERFERATLVEKYAEFLKRIAKKE